MLCVHLIGLNIHLLLLACVLVAQSRLTLCNPIDCSPGSSSVHGIFQASILEWVAISFSRGPFRPKDWTHVSCVSYTAGRFFTHWAIRETHGGTQIERQTVGLFVLPTVPMLGATSRMQPWENNMWLRPSRLYTLWPLCKLLSFWQEVVAICLSYSHPWQASYISSLAY